MRDMLFISHANPEDNEFARWLALQLASEGYGVWCDLTKLLGGERFWDDIDVALRDRTSKFLFVLSRASNGKDSPLDELELAAKVRKVQLLGDFIIPLWVDDLPPEHFHVRLQNLNAIRFQAGWRAGLDTLLRKLEKDSVPKRKGFDSAAVRSWWRTFRDPKFATEEIPETVLTNWFPVGPATYFLHGLDRIDHSFPGPVSLPRELPHPGVLYSDYLVTFAPATDFPSPLGSMRIVEGRQGTLAGWWNGEVEGIWNRGEKSAALVQLLNQSWRRLILKKGLPLYQFSGGEPAFYFRKGKIESDRVQYVGADGKKHWRNVVGVSRIGANPDGSLKVRYWHFGLQARAVGKPRIAFLLKPHVLFSDDGMNIWDSPARLHAARRSFCKSWWNDKWRDLILGTMAWLADEREEVFLPVASTASISVSAIPLTLSSPISFNEIALDDFLNPDDVDFDLDQEAPDEAAADDEDSDLAEADTVDDAEGEE